MFKVMSLRSLINLRVFSSVLIIVILGGSMAIWQAKTAVEQEVHASFNLAVEMIKTGIEQYEKSDTKADWHQVFAALQHSRHIDVALIEESGEQTYLIDGNEDNDKNTAPSWYKSLVITEQLKAQHYITMKSDSVKRIEVSSDPNDEITEAWNESKAYLWSILVMLIIIFITINLVFHKVFKAVGSILSGLRQVESGQYEHTLPNFKIREFDAIAGEINNLSTVLADARKKNRALARHTMQIQEQERQHMSRELHDEMGQSLTAIKAMSVAVKEPEAKIKSIADSIIEICDHLSGVARSMMRTLHPLSLSELGLGATLKDLVSEWRRRNSAMKIDLSYDEHLDKLPDDISIHVYRIVQECLTNVVRHAKADEVKVILEKVDTRKGPHVEIKVLDNGIGGSAEGDGFGIRSMRERVESMQGSFIFKSTIGLGVSVTAKIPFITEPDNEKED